MAGKATAVACIAGVVVGFVIGDFDWIGTSAALFVVFRLLSVVMGR